MSDQSGPTNPSQIVGAVFNGMRINPMRRGSILGWKKGGQIIRALNALLHWRVGLCDGLTPSIQLADNGVLLLIPKPRAVSGTPASSSNLTLMVLSAYYQDSTNGDYIVCAPIGGGASVNVLVEPQLQSSITAQTMPDSTAWLYGTYSASGQSRIATQTAGGSNVLNQYITVPFLVGDIIPVTSITPVTIGTTAWSYLAITGRHWGTPVSA